MTATRVTSFNRSRWAAVGAAVAVSLGAGGLMTASAEVSSGDKPVVISITPCRIADSRPAPDNIGARNGALGPDEAYTFMVHGTNGNCTVPTDAIGVVFNIGVVAPTASSFFTLWPADAPQPLTSNLNFVGGQAALSNAVTVKLSSAGPAGRVSIFNKNGSAHFTADIVAYLVGHNHDDRYYTEVELDARQWTAANILDGSIAEADLADGSVTSGKVLDDTVVGGGLLDVDLAANSVGASEIQTDAVNATEIANDSIDSGEIVDFGLSNEDVGVLFAQVNANGTLANSSGGVTVAPIAAGQYEVDFGRNISSCAFVITQGEAGVGGAVGAITGVTDRGGNAEAVFATIRTHDNVSVDRAFQLVVVC
jgi:hypothetical protein